MSHLSDIEGQIKTMKKTMEEIGQKIVALMNFISSNSTNIKISTTKFGGSLDVAPQPLDTVGLGLRQISLMTTSDANDAAARIEAAINVATRRLNGLESIQRLIQDGDFSGRALTALVTRLSDNALPSGSLVNILG